MHVVLVEPEIPQNTGNIARTCAALGADLHLVHPLGFRVDERAVKRAGLDYWHLLTVHEYGSIDEFIERHGAQELVLFTSRGDVLYSQIRYSIDCFLLFGRETSGLPASLVGSGVGPLARIPVVEEARCLNLSNAVAVAAYEVARQHDFVGLRPTAPDRGPRTPD